MAVITYAVRNTEVMDYIGEDAFEVLREDLAKGIESMIAGRVYTIEEAWKEIDQI